MILLPVDEAYAFDYLSILEIKARKTQDWTAFRQCEDGIQKHCKNYHEIKNSPEYAAILATNLQVFNSVDRAKNNKITARRVVILNNKRYFMKKALQKKFFGSSMAEQKM